MFRVIRETRTPEGERIPLDTRSWFRDKELTKAWLALRQGFIKEGRKAFARACDIAYFDRTVETTWQAIKIDGTEIPVPKSVVRKYYWGPSKPDTNREALGSIENRLSFGWKKIGNPDEDSMKLEAFKKLAVDYRKRVDNLLRR